LAESDVNVREWRRAKNKLALVAVAAQKIEAKALESVSIKEMCDAVSLNEAAFYSFFSKKNELLAYCVQLWNLEIQLRAAHAARGRTGLAMIGEVFEQVARHVQGRPGLTGEMLSYLAKRREGTERVSVTPAEKRIAFPEFQGIDDFEPKPVDELLDFHLREAVARGELPGHTRIDAVASALASFFYGAPIAFRTKKNSINHTYRAHLNLLWLGVRGGGGPPRRVSAEATSGPSLHERRAEP
jgi:AcrR family transcriptional regulator